MSRHVVPGAGRYRFMPILADTVIPSLPDTRRRLREAILGLLAESRGESDGNE